MDWVKVSRHHLTLSTHGAGNACVSIENRSSAVIADAVSGALGQLWAYGFYLASWTGRRSTITVRFAPRVGARKRTVHVEAALVLSFIRDAIGKCRCAEQARVIASSPSSGWAWTLDCFFQLQQDTPCGAGPCVFD